jgi:hypothetical protein
MRKISISRDAKYPHFFMYDSSVGEQQIYLTDKEYKKLIKLKARAKEYQSMLHALYEREEQ